MGERNTRGTKGTRRNSNWRFFCSSCASCVLFLCFLCSVPDLLCKARSHSLPTVFSLLSSGFLFCSACAAEDIRHRVVTLVARVLKDGFLTLSNGKLAAPRPGKRCGIVDRKLIQDRARVCTSEAFG